MPDRNNDREPRWERPGFRPDREENENREGDRSRARNYDRGDQRRYGRQSQEQAERLRSMRGQGPDPRGERNRGDDSGHGERELYRGYGTQIARNEGRFSDRDRDQDRNRDRDQDRDRRDFREQHRGEYDDDFDYDFERDYRNNENTGRDMNLEGSGDPGRQQRDPYRNRGSYEYSGRDRQVEDESDWRDEQTRARDNRENRGGGSGSDRGQDRQDNYWGAREQERRYSRGKDAWWETTGGRPDYTSARSVGSSGRNDAWDEAFDDERSYDMDPGYQYEFGTDFDFMRDTDLDEARRRQERGREDRGREDRGRESQGRQERGREGENRGWENRGQGSRGWENRGQQGRQGQQDRPGQQGQQRQEYGRQQGGGQNQRESWNVPGPYSGMGPGGYKRSDERIQEEICEIFTRHGRLDATGIDIEVQGGQVKLNGSVNRKNEKYLAEDLAAQVTGVQDVENHLRVQAQEGADARTRGRIQNGMRVAGVDGKHIGTVKETRSDGFILERAEGGDTYIPHRAIKRTNGQIFLHVTGGEIDRQGWKEQ